MIITRLLILSFFVNVTVSSAQEFEMKSLLINSNGGSNSIKNKIIFDEDGVTWYNTYNGMVKEFESSHIFVPFIIDQGVEPVQEVNEILLDQKGRFWVTTDQGVFRSDTSKENFQKLNWPIFNKIQTYPSSIVEDCYGNIWMAISKTQVLKITSDTEIKQFKTAEVTLEEQDTNLHIVHRYGCDDIVLQRGTNCFVINQETSQLPEIPIQYRLNNSKSKMDFEVLENGDFFPEDFEGFYNHNGKKFRVTLFEASNLQVMEIPSEMAQISRVENSALKGRMDFVYSGVGDGLERKFGFLKFVKENDEYHLKKIEEISFDYVIESFKIAENGIIYISVFDQIYKIRFTNKGFKKGLHNQKNQDRKINISTRGFLEISEQEFLVATYEGIFKLDLSSSSDFIGGTNMFSYYDLFRAFAKVNDSVTLMIGESAFLKLNHKKNRTVLKVFDKDFAEINFYEIEEYTDFGHIIFHDIEKYTDSIYVLATDKGLGVYDIEDDKLKPYSLFPLASDKAKFVKDINYHNNALYFSTQTDGLFIQNTLTDEVLNIMYKENKEGLPSNYAYTSFIDSNNNLWIGTNKGLACYNKELEKQFTLDKQNGLLDENIVGIQEDKLGNIWFSTYNGLYKYNSKLETVFSYFKEDGLTDNEFNQNSYYTASDGTLYFGGVNGIVAFDTIIDNTMTNIRMLPISTEYFDSESRKDTIITHRESADNNIRLNTKNSSVSITFSINDFFNIENNRYLYKVEGLTDKWQNLGSQNTLKLFSLPPGYYTVKVKGLNSKGIPSTNEITYSIYVPQVWYKRIWFIFTSIIVVIGIFISIAINNVTRQKKKHSIDLMLVELEQKALRAQMNPHFIFNTLNGMRKKLMKRTSDEVEDYIVSFSEFLRHTLDVGRREQILLSKEIQYIKSYIDLINHGSDNNIVLDIQCDTDIDQNKIRILSMIIQPLVENAVIHGFPKNKTDRQIRLNIRRSIKEQQLEVVIKDNGIGIKASLRKKKNRIKTHQSYATQIVNERFELMNKTRKSNTSMYEIFTEDISNNIQSGTRVTIKMPYR